MADRPDMDEPFSLDMDPEEVLRKLLGEDDPEGEDTDSAEDDEP